MFDATIEEIEKRRAKGFGMHESKRFLKIEKLKEANKGSKEPFVQQMIISEILELL